MKKSTGAHNVFIGRQPIYDRQLRVHAYELLFRDSEQNYADFSDGDLATTKLIANTFLEVGLDQVVGHHHAFINLTRNFVLGVLPLPVAPKQVTLEILENITIDSQIIKAITKLSAEGYRIALDDFIFHEEAIPLLEIADLIKIDLTEIGQADLPGYVEKLRKYPGKLLAEKVETQEEYEFCKKLGFDYFQGYFFCKPRVITSQRMPANRLAMLKLLSQISNPDSDIDQLSNIISQDVTLSYRLLRYINSAQFALRTEIDSIDRAVMLLGLDTVRNLASLLVLSNVDDKPFELFITALVRARMCELIARELKIQQSSMYFTAGLFSVIDAMMDQPMEKIITLLPLSDHIAGALVHQTGELGEVLNCVIAYEKGEWDNVAYAQLTNDQFRGFYLEAISWSDEITSNFKQYQAA